MQVGLFGAGGEGLLFGFVSELEVFYVTGHRLLILLILLCTVLTPHPS